MSIGVIGAFAFPGTTVVQAVATSQLLPLGGTRTGDKAYRGGLGPLEA